MRNIAQLRDEKLNVVDAVVYILDRYNKTQPRRIDVMYLNEITDIQ